MLLKAQAGKIIVRPLVSEKAAIAESNGIYSFVVALNSNKVQIANAINAFYGVKPIAVRVVKMKGKKTNFGRRKGSRKDWKKALITLPKGKTIQVHEKV